MDSLSATLSAAAAASVPPATTTAPTLSTAAQTIDGLRQQLCQNTGIDAPAIATQEQIRLKLFGTMIGDLELPPHTDSLQLRHVVLTVFIRLLHQISQEVSLTRENTRAMSDYLHHVLLNPFARANAQQLDRFLSILKANTRLVPVLEKDAIKKTLRVLKFLIVGVDFNCETISELKCKAAKSEFVPETSHGLANSGFLIDHVGLLLDLTFKHIDQEMRALERNLDPTQKIKDLRAALRTRRCNQISEQLRLAAEEWLPIYRKLEHMIRVYKARKDLFQDQLNQMQECLMRATSSSLVEFHLTIEQCVRTLDLLQELAGSLKDHVIKSRDETRFYLPKLTAECIFREENTDSFLDSQQLEEHRETTVRTMDSFLELGQVVTGMLAPPSTKAITEGSGDEKKQDEVSSLSPLIGLLTADLLGKQMEMFTSYNDVLNQLTTAAHQLNQAYEEKRERIQKEIDDAVMKRQITTKQALDIRNLYEEYYRNLCNLAATFKSLDGSLVTLRSLMDVLHKESVQIAPKKDKVATTPFDWLFVEEPCKVKKRSMAARAAASCVTLEPMARSPKPKEVKPPVSTLPAPKVKLSDHLRSIERIVASPEFLEQFQQSNTLPGMVEDGQLAADHAAMYVNYLQATLRLFKRSIRTEQYDLFPLFSMAFMRYCGLISEQQMSAQLLVSSPEAVLTHSHLDLARALGIDDSTSCHHLTSVNQAVISHRYPHSSLLYLTSQNRAIPPTLQWLVGSSTSTPELLIEMANETLNFLTGRLPEEPEGSFSFKAPGRVKYKPHSSPYSEKFSDAFKRLSPMLQSTLHTTQQHVQKCQQFFRGADLEAKTALWNDVVVHLNNIQRCFQCLQAFPQTDTLPVLVDLLLISLQFLDERVEEGLHLYRYGQLLCIHDLQRYRVLRGHEEEPAHQQVVDDLNIGFAAQYPLRYVAHGGGRPAAIRCRLDALHFAKSASQVDLEAQNRQHSQQEGYKVKDKSGKAVEPETHPLTALHNDLIRLTKGVLEMTAERLKQLK